ncbi:MAG TPA: phosphoribosylanthranilate isomerase [Gemmatimonadaceae bacterium]|jgi:phosphoribosylanthranilate isomerase
MTAIKFCGITRTDDARQAARLGARFVGAILTQSPRRVSAGAAREIYSAAGNGIAGVAVFRNEDIEEIVALSNEAGARVIQIHRRLTAAELARIRDQFDGQIWTVLDVEPGREANAYTGRGANADGVLIDASRDGRSGGTGTALNWPSLAPIAATVRPGHTLIIAGGLTPENVVDAISALEPDVVDVSSGVESAPGMKDHSMMEAFARAVSSAQR